MKALCFLTTVSWGVYIKYVYPPFLETLTTQSFRLYAHRIPLGSWDGPGMLPHTLSIAYQHMLREISKALGLGPRAKCELWLTFSTLFRRRATCSLATH